MARWPLSDTAPARAATALAHRLASGARAAFARAASGSPSRLMAFSLLAGNWSRTLTTTLGCALATALMMYQGSLIHGFLKAGGEVVDAADGDIWLVAPGATAVEYLTPIDGRYESLARGHRDVAATQRLVIGFASWVNPAGDPLSVLMVGGDPAQFTRGRALRMATQERLHPWLIAEQSAVQVLGVPALPARAEINGRRVFVTGTIEGFGSFLGPPTVLTGLREAQRFMGLRRDQCMAIVLKLAPGADKAAVIADLGRRFPELSVLDQADYGLASATFWLIRTGAGGGLLLSALLGFVIGLTIVSQSLYSNTLENFTHFLTLRTLGVSQAQLRRVVVTQAMTVAGVGGVLGIVLCWPFIPLTEAFVVSWIHTPAWLPPAVVLIALPLGRMASLSTVRLLSTLQPAEAFRR